MQRPLARSFVEQVAAAQVGEEASNVGGRPLLVDAELLAEPR